MNREVMGRQMFANGGAAMPAAPGPQVTAPGLPPVDPNSVDINQAAQGAMQQGIDPAMMEGMLTQYAGQLDNLENAQDYETVINGIRGDSAPIEQRYQELSQVVGPEDSQATPESVLTLLQPVMQMAEVDQGIGGLAAQEMNAPIEGAMAEGIMSTVNMGAPEAPMQGPGGPVPVNFNQGGAVQYFAPENTDRVAGGSLPFLNPLQQKYDARKELYNQIIGERAYDEADLQEEKNLTKAQMLFDVANTALAFATPGSQSMSPAERLAQAATETQLFDKIGSRAREQMVTERSRAKDMRDEKMKINLMALQGAEAAELQSIKNRTTGTGVQNFTNKDGSIFITTKKNSPEYDAAVKDPDLFATGPRKQGSDGALEPINFLNVKTGEKVSVYPNTEEADEYVKNPDFVYTGMATQTPPSSKRITLFNPATKETKNPLETDPIIDTLLEKGFQVITTPPKPTADYITIYDPDTKETQNVDKNDPNLQDLMDDGFEIVTTPPRPKTPKLDAKTLYVTDAERLKAYANGTLDPSQTAGLEQVLGEMQRPSTVVENGQQVTRPAKAFSLPIVEAIRAREEAGYPTSTFDLPEKVEVSKAVLSIEQQPTLSGKITALQQYRDKNTGKLPKKLLNSKVFAETLLGESGNADLDSDSWRMIPTQIFDEKADYNLARGLSTIPDRLVSAFVELTGDITGSRVNDEGLLIYQADRDMSALQTRTLGLLTDVITDERVLKSLQDNINEAVKPIEPGVFKFDAKAEAAMRSIAEILAQEFDSQIMRLPEYGGDSTLYSNKQIQTARASTTKIKNLIAEYIAFADNTKAFMEGNTTSGGQAGDQTLPAQRNMLYMEAQKQRRGGE